MVLSLSEAVRGDGEDDIVELQGDTTLAEPLEVSRSVTLNLNGYTLKGNDSDSVIKITGGTFTLEDTGGGVITGGGNKGGVYVANSTFEMIGGTIKARKASDEENGEKGKALDCPLSISPLLPIMVV